MPIFLLTLIARAGIPGRFAKVTAWALIVLLAVGLALILIARHDRQTITSHDTAQTIEVLETTEAANENAATARRVDDATLTKQTTEIERTIDAAPPPTSGISDARREYLRCVREQQTGRRDPSSTASRSCL